jgi:hypothetical protein
MEIHAHFIPNTITLVVICILYILSITSIESLIDRLKSRRKLRKEVISSILKSGHGSVLNIIRHVSGNTSIIYFETSEESTLLLLKTKKGKSK